jgi:hypothetical protein
LIIDSQALVSRPDPPASAGGRGLTLDRSVGAFLACASVLIVGGGVVAAVNSAAPRAHGSWLAAYLVLVGGVSQVLLGAGRLALRAPRPTRALRRAQLVLWNLGSVAVPAGVLADAPMLVTVGSIALLLALALFAAGASEGRPDLRAVVYLAIIAGLAVSVVVGSALADAAPGAWL